MKLHFDKHNKNKREGNIKLLFIKIGNSKDYNCRMIGSVMKN